ncbi:hypothetical protein [Bacillus subtilis]|uniref:Phage protein n=1 Tax=Bacillus subtilis TaxID=1423 RepID=A0AAP1H6T2_BACIU|nr:hypothetical protein [Bacillus subtilis]KIN55623.1 hypothetical protein B4146_3104 [Bacillus subtilis]KZD89339.1 Phage protein [Bacillus subtilis]
MFNPSDWYITPQEYERAAKNGIDKIRLERRIRFSGWDKERAITTPVKKRKPKSKWADVAVSNGIHRNLFFARVNRLGWDEEKAATTPASDVRENMKKVQKHSSRNKHYRHSPELIALAESNGIKYLTYINRVNNCGMDPYEAAVTPLRTRKEAAELGRKAFQEKYGDVNGLFFQKRRASN